MVYDNKDRLIATQDGNQRDLSPNEWNHFDYDNLNRIIKEGKIATYSSRSVIESDALDGQIDTSNYSSYDYYTYYDYDGEYWYASYHSSDAAALGVSKADNNKGRLTQKVYRIPDDLSVQPQQLIEEIYYDKFGRVIQTVKDNHLESANGCGIDYITNKYSFDGLLIQKRHRHLEGWGASSTETVLDYYYDYDHRGRLLKTRLKINSGTETVLAANV